MKIEIVYASETYFKSFHEALDKVAREQIYIEMIEAKPLELVSEFQMKLIINNWPVYYAIHDERVIGWLDITVGAHSRIAHRGFLGMGLVDGYRGQGVGSRLMEKAFDHAKKIGLEKIELSVYTTNDRAIGLYRKFGFTEIGVVKHFRKLNGKYFDCLQMEKFF